MDYLDNFTFFQMTFCVAMEVVVQLWLGIFLSFSHSTLGFSGSWGLLFVDWESLRDSLSVLMLRSLLSGGHPWPNAKTYLLSHCWWCWDFEILGAILYDKWHRMWLQLWFWLMQNILNLIIQSSYSPYFSALILTWEFLWSHLLLPYCQSDLRHKHNPM